MARQEGLFAYEERYSLVFGAGGLFWNDPRPNQSLSRLLDQLPAALRCIEFGCGEGYQARFMSSRGHSVTAIDLSPTAIAKAIRETPPAREIDFLVGDVTDASALGLERDSFDLAVNIGCLHMMAEDEDRANHLNLIRDVLKAGGKLFLQNGLDLDDVLPCSEEEAKYVAEAMSTRGKPAGYPLPYKIVTFEGERELVLPLCPAGRMLSLDGYVREVTSCGFHVLSAERVTGGNASWEASIVAEKT
jgi:SAM-dependent methyltransferase